MRTLLSLALAALFSSAVALAVPAGYEQTLQTTGVANSGAPAIASGFLYFARSVDGDYFAESVFRVELTTGTATLYANNFGSVTALYADPSSGVLFAADNDTNSVGDGDCVWRLADGNGDGDCLDAGEVTLYTASGSLADAAGLALAPTGRLYVTDASGGGAGDLFAAEDQDADGDCLDAGELWIFATDVESAGAYLAGVDVSPIDATLVLVNDSSGTVTGLRDTNSDGDADDLGERFTFASGLAGGYDLKFDAEGDLFVSATDWFAGTSLLYQCRTDGPDGALLSDEVTVFADLSAVAASVTGIAFDSRTLPFEPGAGGGATLYVSYWDTSWMNPDSMIAIAPVEIEVPATSPWSALVLLGLISAALAVGRRVAGR